MVLRLAAERDLQRDVSETACEPPEARSSFSLCAHPERDELYLYGGEYYNGKQASRAPQRRHGDDAIYRV